jgi:hypothetical protein
MQSLALLLRDQVDAAGARAPGQLTKPVRALRYRVEWSHADKVEHLLMSCLVKRGLNWEWPAFRRFFDLSCLARQAIDALHALAEREPDWKADDRRRAWMHARDLVQLIVELQRVVTRELFFEIVVRCDDQSVTALGRRRDRCDAQLERVCAEQIAGRTARN